MNAPLAKERTAAKTHALRSSPETVHWGYLDGGLEPVLTVDSGDRVVIESVSGNPEWMPAKSTGFEILPELKDIHQCVKRGTGNHMEACGQIPSVLKKEIQGFILNRLQYAVISEAYRLWEDGVAGVEDIDKTMRDALGLRWSFMGPMETISLNAPGGVPDYDERYGQIVLEVNSSQEARAWDKEAVQRLEEERLRSRPIKDIASRRAWRDRRLMALLAHKRQMSETEGD